MKISQRSPSQRQDPASLNDQQAIVLDTLCETTSKTGTQPHPLAERLPKIIVRPQTPQNTPPDVDLPARKTRSSLIRQNTGTSPLHQEAYTTHWTNLSHWGQIPKTTGTTNLQPAKRRPQTQEKKRTYKNKPKTIKNMVIGTYISIITLNMNELNEPIKRHRLAEWIQKEDPSIWCLQETHFWPRDTYRLKVRGWKKIFHANGNQKEAGVAILILDKIDFKIKNVTGDKEGHYIMIKGSSEKKI